MLPRRLAAWLALALSTGAAVAQTGPQLLTVTPPGARQGDTVEVTVAGAAFDGPEGLLFSDPKVTAEPVTAKAVPIDPKKGKDGGTKGMKGGAQPTAAAKFKVTVPKGTPVGTLDVRVVTKNGVSNPRAFVVGDLPELAEKEPNNDVAEAQPVEPGTTVNGVIAAPTDVDFVAVKAKPGQKLVAACLTGSIDSRLQADLQVFAADGRPLAANRGYSGGDAVADFTAPADGVCYIRLSSFAYVSGGTDHYYRLTVTPGPWVDAVFPPVIDPAGKPADFAVSGRNLPSDPFPLKKFALPGKTPADALQTDLVVAPAAAGIDAVGVRVPLPGSATNPALLALAVGPVVLDAGDNDTPDKAQAVTVPADIAGRIEKKGDRDVYRFTAKKGEPLTLELFADRLGSPVDAFFVLTDEKGKVIAEVDDSPETLSPNQFYTKSDDPGRYRFNPPADGTYRVSVSTREAAVQAGARDVYLLRVAKEKPDFRLAVMPLTPHVPEAAALPKNGTTLLTVYVWRVDGFDGAVTLSASNLPPGVTCPPQVVGPGQTRGTLVFSAAKDAKDWTGFVTVTGTATVDGKPVAHAARPFSVTWPLAGNQGNPPNSPVLTRLDRGPGVALAVRGVAPFRLAAASAAPVKVKAGDKAEVAVKLDRLDNKDAVQLFSASGFTGKPAGGNNAPTPLATIDAGKTDAKVTLEIPTNTAPGTYSVVLRGVVPDAGKGPNNAPKPPKAYAPSLPITLEIEAKPVAPKKK